MMYWATSCCRFLVIQRLMVYQQLLPRPQLDQIPTPPLSLLPPPTAVAAHNPNLPLPLLLRLLPRPHLRRKMMTIRCHLSNVLMTHGTSDIYLSINQPIYQIVVNCYLLS